MSEERRKRQLERVGAPETSGLSRTTLIWGGIAVVVVLAYVAGWFYTSYRYDDFAKCLTTHQAKMYGLYWCPHCAEQKKKFGKSIRFVNYVECAIKGSKELAPECKAAGVKLFPSWQFGANPPVEGVFPMQELSDKTGCALP